MAKDKYDYMEKANEIERRRQQDKMRNDKSSYDSNNANDRVRHFNEGDKRGSDKKK